MPFETWYVLEDETVAHPRDVRPGKDEKLVHKDGRKVAYAPHGPRSRSIDPEVEIAKAKAPKAKPVAQESKPAEEKPADAASGQTKAREMTAEKPKGGYKTRDGKAD